MELQNVKKALKNDDSLFVQLIEEKQEKLMKIAYRYYLSEACVEDVLSETIYKAYRYRRKCKHPEYFDTWIIRILMNECVKEIKNNLNELTIDIADSSSQDIVLRSMVYDMSEPERSIIILHFFEGYTLDNIAQILDMPSSTLKSKYYKALQGLRNEMKGEAYEY